MSAIDGIGRLVRGSIIGVGSRGGELCGGGPQISRHANPTNRKIYSAGKIFGLKLGLTAHHFGKLAAILVNGEYFTRSFDVERNQPIEIGL